MGWGRRALAAAALIAVGEGNALGQVPPPAGATNELGAPQSTCSPQAQLCECLSGPKRATDTLCFLPGQCEAFRLQYPNALVEIGCHLEGKPPEDPAALEAARKQHEEEQRIARERHERLAAQLAEQRARDQAALTAGESERDRLLRRKRERQAEPGGVAVVGDTPGMLRELCAAGPTPAIVPPPPKFRVGPQTKRSIWHPSTWCASADAAKERACKEEWGDAFVETTADLLVTGIKMVHPGYGELADYAVSGAVWSAKVAKAAGKGIDRNSKEELDRVSAIQAQFKQQVDELNAERASLGEPEYQRRLASLRQRQRVLLGEGATKTHGWKSTLIEGLGSREALTTATAEAGSELAKRQIAAGAATEDAVKRRLALEGLAEDEARHNRWIEETWKQVNGSAAEHLDVGKLAVRNAYRGIVASTAGRVADAAVGEAASRAIAATAAAPGAERSDGGPAPRYFPACESRRP